MDPISTRILLGTAGAGPSIVLPNIGDYWTEQGGYFVGTISHTANGVATHALITADRTLGAQGNGYTGSDLQCQASPVSLRGASSLYDGVANSNAYGSTSPAVNFCTALNIAGFTDWYLPAIMELEIAYFHLKPLATPNSTSYGTNDYSVPKRTSNYTSGNPGETSVQAFRRTTNPVGTQSFEAETNGGLHWSSTETSSTTGNRLDFGYGIVQNANKLNAEKVRAFRRIAL